MNTYIITKQQITSIQKLPQNNMIVTEIDGQESTGAIV